MAKSIARINNEGNLDIMVSMALNILRETIRLGHNAKMAIEPYTDTVKKLVAEQLTYSEQKACGLLSDDANDTVQEYLKSMCNHREKKAYERQNVQTSRKGWKPRKTSNRKLARDIADSLRQHPDRTVDFYQVSEEVAAMISDLLAKG